MRNLSPPILVLLFLVQNGMIAQVGVPTFLDTMEVYEDLFWDEYPIRLTLTLDLKEFQKTRKDEKYHPATLTCQVNDTFSVRHPVRLKTRGFYRRDHCSTPPFYLNIRYSGIEAEELRDITRIKVVTHCKSSGHYQDYILREYLVYRILNLVTPFSFRTRLVEMKYIDTGRKNQESGGWAFLIEPEEMMAKRLGGHEVKSDNLAMRTVNPEAMDLLAMFQYMIGNGDYSVTGRHNLKILFMDIAGPHGFIPVPYDFDYTGLVNTHYAVPGDDLGITNVRERYFLGPCRSEKLHLKAVEQLRSVREEIINLILGFEYLDEAARMDMIGYIESFFAETNQEKFVERHISATCR
jgi:hypothetical protein